MRKGRPLGRGKPPRPGSDTGWWTVIARTIGMENHRRPGHKAADALGGTMALSQDITEMLAELGRAGQDLEATLSPFLDTDRPSIPSLARLQEIADRNAQSAKLIQLILQGQAWDEVVLALLRGELEGAVAYFEDVAAVLAARIKQAGRE